MRFVVTGATGHVGAHLVRQLVRQRSDVAVLIRPESNPWRIADLLPHIHVIRGDVNAIHACAEQIERFRPDVVVHLAWHGVGAGRRDDLEQVTVNLNGTLQLIDIAHRSGCRRWIGVGSQAEYGVTNQLLTEELLPEPATLYGAAKLSAFHLSRRLCAINGMEHVWLRLLATYGPMEPADRLIPYVIIELLRGRKPALTHGNQHWDYLYVDDAVSAIWGAATIPGLTGLFNLGSGQAHTIRSIVEQIREAVGTDVAFGFGERSYPPDGIMHLQADVTRLQRATGWSPQVGLVEGLCKTVEWYRQNLHTLPAHSASS